MRPLNVNISLHLLVLVALLAVHLQMYSQPKSFQNDLDEFLRLGALRNATVGLVIYDVSSGEIVAEHNRKKSLVPASSMKILTTATALEVFGREHRFETRMGFSGEITVNGTLLGDVWIIGGGDPCLGSPRFDRNYEGFLAKWASAISAAGISQLEGDIIVDDGYFRGPPLAGSTPIEDAGNYYGAGAYGVNYRDNTYKLYFDTGKEGSFSEVVFTDPVVPGLQITNEVVSAKSNRDQAYIYGGPGIYHQIVRGSLPENRHDFVIKGALPSPPYQLGHELAEELSKLGIVMKGGVRVVDQNSDMAPARRNIKVLSIQESPVLDEIIQSIHSESVNVYADVLLKHLGKLKDSDGSYLLGALNCKNHWTWKDLDTRGWYQVDGSGLSRLNGMSADILASVLVEMETNDFFEKSLKPFGKSGKIRAKSGYLERVRSYAGYIDREGKKYAFAIIVNNHNGYSTGLKHKITLLFEDFLKSD